MKRCLLLVLLPAFMLAAGCEKSAESAAVSLFCMDTYCTIEAHGPDAEAAVAAAAEELERLERLFSIGLADSELSRINASAGGDMRLSDDMARLLETSLEVSEETDGAFDVSVEPLVRAWGFYGGSPAVPSGETLEEALLHVDYARLELSGNTLRLQSGQGLDLGGVAKGYAGDRLTALMAAYGVTGASVSLGGNVQTLGERPGGGAWRIGLRSPLDEEALLCVLAAEDCAVVTAGSYQRWFEEAGQRYHHILDPATGRPAESGLLSVTVVAADGARADALSTALFVMGRERAEAFWRQSGGAFEMLLFTDEGELRYTAGIEPMLISLLYEPAVFVE
ncbi:MAG: FAD:protein FMN transferase [Clostridia bacterium]|nr:FAD:protein FMN transferase [Clostridia bacterium]